MLSLMPAIGAPAPSRGRTFDLDRDAGQSTPNIVDPTPIRKATPAAKQKRWGIIMAGGNGTRLKSLTRMISGDDRPKQFCRVLGRYSLLEQAQFRAARSIPAKNTIVVLTHAHEHYFAQHLEQSESQRLIQPYNRGTAPPILLGLMNIARQERDALVAILPSNHYYSDENAFTQSLESAFSIAGKNPESVVLLGVKPKGPEAEFGWIEVGPAAHASHADVFAVQGFKERPSVHVAEQLFRNGALWNTFVMVGSVTAFLRLAWAEVPALVETLGTSLPVLSDSMDISIPPSLYDAISPADFSRHILTGESERLMALRLDGLEWHDLGQPDRVISVLRTRSKAIPHWIHHWESTRRAAMPLGCVTPNFPRQLGPSS